MKREIRSFRTSNDNKPGVNTTKAIENMIHYMKHKPGKTPNSTNTLSDKTITGRVNHVREIMEWHKPFEFSQAYIDRVKMDVESRMSGGSARNYLYALEDLFRGNNIMFDGNVTRIGKPRQMHDTEKDFHSRDEIFKLIEAVQNHQRNYTLLTVLWYTGCREGEAAAIKIEDIDIEACRIKITGFKTARKRPVPVPSACMQRIQEYLTFRRQNDISDEKYPYLFVNMIDGGKLSEHQVYNIVTDTGIKVGIKTNPHKWRHSRCSYLLNELKMPAKRVSLITGHSVKTLLEWYDHSTLEAVAADLKKYEG